MHEVRCDLPVRPQESEVAWHAWLSEEELAEQVADGEWEWVPDGLEAYRRLRAHRESGQ